MYNAALLLHSYTRWLVVLVMIWALGRAWWGLLKGSLWNEQDRWAGAAFAVLVTVQFVWGVLLFFVPEGIAQAALRDMGASMRVRELRFFGLEHPLQMLIALTLTHLGWTRSRKAVKDKLKFRWAAGAYTVATLLILSAIPWWRPFARPITTEAPATVQGMVIEAVTPGDATRGQTLFAQPTSGLPACATCHTLGEERLVGPGLGGLAVRAAQRVAGQTAAQYLYTSIVQPSAHIVEGYVDVMPATYGTVLSAEQLQDLTAYLLTLDEE